MGTLFVDKLDPQSGTSLEIGSSGDTVSVPSGAELKSNKISPASGTSFTLGDSGDTFTIPSGVTFANSGTATGFGGSSDVIFAATMQTSNQSLSHEVWTKVNFNDEIYDVGTCYDHSTNYRFTVPSGKGGYYHIGYSLIIENSANSRQYISFVRPYKNGSNFLLGSGSFGSQTQFYQNNTDNPTRNIHATKSFIINLSASDYIEIYAQSATNNSSSSNARGDGAMFWGYKLIT